MKDLNSFEFGKFILIFFCISASNSLCEQAQSLNAGHDLDARVDGILSQLTLSQKLDYIGGTGFFDVKPVPPVANFPGEFNPQIYQTDGPLGARRNSPGVRFPSGLTLAATWNPALAYEQGAAMGEDVRARGYFAIEGPGLNLYRVPLNGRNFEYVAGEDPYLGSQFAPAEIMGIQSKRGLGFGDYEAIHNGVKAALNGCDLDLPKGKSTVLITRPCRQFITARHRLLSNHFIKVLPTCQRCIRTGVSDLSGQNNGSRPSLMVIQKFPEEL